MARLTKCAPTAGSRSAGLIRREAELPMIAASKRASRASSGYAQRWLWSAGSRGKPACSGSAPQGSSAASSSHSAALPQANTASTPSAKRRQVTGLELEVEEDIGQTAADQQDDPYSKSADGHGHPH